MTHTRWRAEIPQLLLLAGMFIAAAVIWPFAPQQFPAHWNLHGDVDRYAGPIKGLFALPLVAAGLYALLLILPKIDPGRANYASFRRAYRMIGLAVIGLLASLYACTLLTAFGHHVPMRAVVPLTVGILLIIIGNYMGKLRPNWFAGVRTPWTLSSRLSWNKTHRLARWLMMAMGLAWVACAVVQTGWMVALAVTFNVAAILWLVVYSYVVWRNDPERQSPAGTSPSPGEGER
jgi:uncharacterized membrane protein